MYLAGYTIGTGKMNDLTFIQILAILCMKKIVWEYKDKNKALLTVG